MSRKKSVTDQNNLKKIGERIKQLRKSLGPKGLSQRKFAKSIGISGNYVSNLEKGFYEPSMPILIAIERRYSIIPEQILTGKGFDVHKVKVIYSNERKEYPPVKEVRPDFSPAQISKADLLNMAKEVLESNTEYEVSLAANIRAFYHALESKKLLEDHNELLVNYGQRIADLEEQLKDAAQRAAVAATKNKAT